MIWNIVEYIVTIIEYYIYADFMVKFLNPKIKSQTVLCYGIIVFFDSAITIIFNYYTIFEGILCSLRIIGNFIIAKIFLKGTTYEKIFASFITDTSVLLINFITLSIFSRIFEKSIAELITERGILRITILFITKFLFFIITRLIIKMKKKDEYAFSVTEWITLSVIFITTMFVEIQIFLLSMKYNLSINSLFSISAGISLILINILVYILMMKISRNNKEKTSLIIDKMRLEMYKSQLYESEKRYDEITKIRHDMKNYLYCALNLAKQGDNNAELIKYLENLSKNKIDKIIDYVQVNRKILSIIINSKIGTAKNKNINIQCMVMSELDNISDIDVGILIANLLDNAIEACEKNKKESEIILKLWSNAGYYCINIMNTVETDVLINNPHLVTSKKNKMMHGIGLNSVKDIVQKYNGMINFEQKSNRFYVYVSLSKCIL